MSNTWWGKKTPRTPIAVPVVVYHYQNHMPGFERLAKKGDAIKGEVRQKNFIGSKFLSAPNSEKSQKAI